LLREVSDSDDYDFDNMRDMIDTDYPPDWDPWKDWRNNTLTSFDRQPGTQMCGTTLGDESSRPNNMGDDIFSSVGGQSRVDLVEVEVVEMEWAMRVQKCRFSEGKVE